MKHYFPFLLYALSGLVLFSCQGNELDGPLPGPAPTRLLGDGGTVSGVNLYCIEKHNSHIGEPYYLYYSRVKTVESYSDFYLQLELYQNAGLYYQSDDIEEMGSIEKLELEYYKRKSAFIVEDYENYRNETKSSMVWPELITAYTHGEVSITCDKALFGEGPDTNLNKYFMVNKGLTDMDSKCLPIGIDSPRLLYRFGEEIPSDMDKFFVKETWLQPKYYLQMKELPTERYDSLTLYLTFPMIREHVRDYAVAKYRGKDITAPQLTEDVFKAVCPIKFSWE